MCEKELHIFLVFIAITKLLEVQVSENASFHDIFKALMEMKILKQMSDDTIIYERESMQRCDMDVSLAFMHVQNGMVFQVY